MQASCCRYVMGRAGVLSLTPPPEVHQLDVEPAPDLVEDGRTMASPRSPDSPLPYDAAAGVELTPRSSSPPPPDGVRRGKPTVPPRHVSVTRHSSSSSSSPRLTLKFQKDASPPPPPSLSNGRWRTTSGGDVIGNRCVVVLLAAGTRDVIDHVVHRHRRRKYLQLSGKGL